MIPVAKAAEIRNAERASGRSTFDLMDEAGSTIVALASKMIGTLRGKRVAIFCGKGNNGGDGIAAARHFARLGAQPTVLLPTEISSVAKLHLDLLPRGVRLGDASVGARAKISGRCDLCVDAVLGVGAEGAPRPEILELLSTMQTVSAPILSVDLPTGIDPETGADYGARSADATLCLGAVAPGNLLNFGAQKSGQLWWTSLGLAVDSAYGWLPESADVAERLPKRLTGSHKYQNGAVGILAGSLSMPGAASLCAAGAVGAGASFVALGVVSSLVDSLSSVPPEVVRHGLSQTQGHLNAESVDEFLKRFPQLDVVSIGPGIGRTQSALDAVGRLLESNLPVVIDADALYAVGESMSNPRLSPLILTPHQGEFERLGVGDPQQLADDLNAVVHLKGKYARTFKNDKPTCFNSTGDAALATAGTGDVLTGAIGALVARGMSDYDATWSAAMIHGRAGEMCARSLGREQTSASSVASMLRRSMHSFEFAARSQGAIVEVGA